MYWDRERSCGDWYKDLWSEMDKKHGDKAMIFLKSEAENNQLMGELD
jgi:hypothetical protein